jgi:putative YjhG/YagF family dehydratase
MPTPADFLSSDASLFALRTKAPGPVGSLPLTDELLRNSPSGDLFGATQNVGMGWEPAQALGRQFLILSTQGGLRAPNGKPIALGYHTGHWEIGLLVEAAARELRAVGAVPFAAAVSDPCDGRSQGTTGMFDSLPYRNDAAIVFRRLIRSLPRRLGVIGVATCDKGLPAMMMALAAMHDLPTIIVPGGVTLPPSDGEDAGAVQTIGARYSRGLLTLQEAADLGCRACASPGGGCQFLGTAATSQVVAEALGLALPHSALAPSGEAVWLDLARQSALAVAGLAERGVTTKDILTAGASRMR